MISQQASGASFPGEELTREIFGNVSPASKLTFYLLAAASLAIFGYGIWSRWRLWKLGKDDAERPSLAASLRRFAARVLTQRAVRGRGGASAAHTLLFGGFCLLAMGSGLIAIEHYAHDFTGRGSTDPIFHKGVYYAVFEVTLELAGIAMLIGACWFLARRLRGDTSIGHVTADYVILGVLVFLGISGYATEGLRILRESTHQPEYSFVGLLFAKGFAACGVGESQSNSLHLVLWWVHSIGALGLIADRKSVV